MNQKITVPPTEKRWIPGRTEQIDAPAGGVDFTAPASAFHGRMGRFGDERMGAQRLLCRDRHIRRHQPTGVLSGQARRTENQSPLTTCG